jgi:hypothetical protein
MTLFAHYSTALVLIVAFGSVACGTESTKEQASVSPAGTTLPLDHPVVTEPATHLRSRRLSVAQWRATYPRLLGNDINGAPIVWRNLTDPSTSAGLGEPDFLATTEEALEPNVVYAKYNDDAARDGCAKAVAADVQRIEQGKASSERMVMREVTPASSSDDSAVRANLVYLKRHFHGVLAQPNDVQRIEPLHTLYTSVIASSKATTPEAKAQAAWRTVCAGLLTSPEFNAY